MLSTRPAPSPAWLTSALRDAGALAAGEVRDVRVLSPRTTPASTVTRLAVGDGAGAPASAPTRLFLTTPRPELPRDVSRHLGEREVRLYWDLAPAMPEAPLIRCHSAACSPTDGGWHLLLHDLTDTHAPVASQQPTTPSALGSAIAALAAIHARWWDKDPPSTDAADRRLPDEPPPRGWEERRRRSVGPRR